MYATAVILFLMVGMGMIVGVAYLVAWLFTITPLAGMVVGALVLCWIVVFIFASVA